VNSDRTGNAWVINNAILKRKDNSDVATVVAQPVDAILRDEKPKDVYSFHRANPLGVK